jgi:hypothetical protein
MVSQQRFNRDDVPMRELRLTDGKGLGLACMLYGDSAEQLVPQGAFCTIFYGEGRPPLPDKEAEGGYFWVFDSGMLLLCPPL